MRKAIPRLQVEIYSYVNDIALSIMDKDSTSDIARIVKKEGKIIREIPKADEIPLENEKE